MDNFQFACFNNETTCTSIRYEKEVPYFSHTDIKRLGHRRLWRVAAIRSLRSTCLIMIYLALSGLSELLQGNFNRYC